MPRLLKALMLGLIIGIAGLALSSMMQSFEENAGLGLLFKLRGARQAPSDAVVISIDKESSEHLDLPDSPEKWPRSLHARLMDRLVKAGARVVAFDLHFIEPRAAGDDRLFAGAIRRAGNVVLCQPLKLKEVPLSDGGESDSIGHTIVKVVQPIELFSHAAAATAPFTLPRIPFKVNQYWTFETGAGDSPTMPAVALQIFTMPAYGDFIALLQKVSPEQAKKLSHDGAAAIKTKGMKELMNEIRDVFESDPSIEERMLREAENSEALSGDEEKRRMLKALIRMYGGINSRYINFYGPPGSVTTIPYYRALQFSDRAGADKKLDLRGKAVFVGLSEILLSERKDSFYTEFSRANGTFISGVEIMATAFSNLLTDTPVKPAGTYPRILMIILWGIILGVVCRVFPVGVAAPSAVILSALYLVLAEYQFKTSHTWYPVVIPIFVQAPLAFFGALAWDYFDASKELKNVRSAFGHYLPKDVVNQLAKDVAYIKTESKIIDGVCLMTDAQQYTTLSETMGPHELRGFMNRYYETMFKPVEQYGGIVSDVTGDAMLALWVTTRSNVDLKKSACSAALGINRAFGQFKQKASDPVKIRTRIGIHCGKISLGNLGALGHYQYRPIGDIVNTTSRLEGLNKYLGSSVLVSEEVIHGLDDFLVREVGKFRLKGKAKPIAAYELLGFMEEAGEKQRSACAVFDRAMSAYRLRSWDEAEENFNRCIEMLGTDGPSLFYVELCKRHRQMTPEESWDCVVCMDNK
jgi:adenylate cyclase